MTEKQDGENMEEIEGNSRRQNGGVMEQAERRRERTDDCMK